MSTTNVNGRFRKTLAEQIDRLDQILDGLADGLNEAVAMAVKEAVAVAVKETAHAVLTEVLTNPAILGKLHGAAAPGVQPVKETPKPGLRADLARLGGWIATQVRSACQAGSALLDRAGQACVKLCAKVRRGCACSWGCVEAVRHVRVQLLTAVGVGVAAGMAAYLAGPWLAASVSAAGVFAATLAAHTGLWLRRKLPRFLGERFVTIAGNDSAA
jgi:hypothetical protein